VVAISSAGAAMGASRSAAAFGDPGAFNPRVLLTGNAKWEGLRSSAPARWSAELERRTSAPSRLAPTKVRADDPALLAEPFALWAGDGEISPLTAREVRGVSRFLAMGGVLFVDDFDPTAGTFGRAAKRELAKVVPDAVPIVIGSENVVFRSFYLLSRPYGRIEGPDKLEAIVRGGAVQVIFSAHDLCGALARGASGVHPIDVVPGGEAQRERAVRTAVNVAMYVLCSNYKDDQVHAEHLMRRRGSSP
jgi:hypothetical protein